MRSSLSVQCNFNLFNRCRTKNLPRQIKFKQSDIRNFPVFLCRFGILVNTLSDTMGKIFSLIHIGKIIEFCVLFKLDKDAEVDH